MRLLVKFCKECPISALLLRKMISRGMWGLADIPSYTSWKSHMNHTSADGSNKSVKCSLKASESYLFPLAKYFLFVPKPPTYIPHDDVVKVSFLRVDRASTSRTFEIKISMRQGPEYQFSNIAK